MVRFFPKNVEYKTWDWIRIVLQLLCIGIIIGAVGITAVHMRTDWLDQLRTILGGG